jgi:integrase
MKTYSESEGRWRNNFMRVYQRQSENGEMQWYVDFSHSGRRYRLNIEKMLNEVLAGKFVLESKMDKSITLGEFIDKHFIPWAKTNLTHPEKWLYVNLKPLRKAFGDLCLLSDITPRAVEEYKNKRLTDRKLDRYGNPIKTDKKVSPSTVNRELACLRRLFSLAMTWSFVASNPVSRVKFLKEVNEKDRTLTKEEEKRLLAECDDSIRDIVIVGLHTGMRINEILDLTWEQTDLENEVIVVQHTKNKKIRKIPMNSVLRRLFENVKILDRHQRYVFKHGNIRYSSVAWAFRKAVKKAGISRITLHGLRHTYGTQSVNVGVDLVTVKENLGHSSLETTMRYLHPSPEHKKIAAEKLVDENIWQYIGTNIGKQHSSTSTQRTQVQ